ncbi:uncharacterized protein LOC116004534 [Ipomoea triloba]|uniref:uncharacterized protein LOC116004534 n=1 Tax=Ipomoea triloba TaxID=35885 RepID=UPI00125D4E6F|nr:uncharacterized protein LOC116004534 [Ipomoea triloba]XP_031100485.1 uncharacterized protein LOC116004534 [Ipomoea triloba]
MTIGLDKVVDDVASKAVSELVQFVAKNFNLVVGIESEIIDLTSDIETFNARLVDASKIPRAKELQVMKVIVKKFRAVVDEAQDAVDKYLAEKKNHEEKTFTKCLDKVPHLGKVNASASEIQTIRTKVNAIFQNHEKDLLFVMKYPNNSPSHFEQTRPVVEKDKVLGFDDDLITIKDRINIEASNDFIVIPIVGRAGSGKTTFATKVFEGQDVLNNSFHRIWVHVSQRFDSKQKLIDIIHQIKNHTNDYSSTLIDRLKDEIRRLLTDLKYFIVLDDVWERNVWESLKEALPKNMNGSRVLVTTRYDHVVDSEWKPHYLTELSEHDSWLLLKKNVFGEEECDTKLFEEHGKTIAKRCNGLPLAIRVIAGILCKHRTIADWERVAKNPFLEMNREGQSYHQVVMLSYEDLPHERLKNCFLYFATFPMGYEIAVWKLIRLWIVEEFIPTIDEWGYPLEVEVEAQKYLNDLVNMNLVMVMKRRVDGQIKTCRIHDSLHEFCKSEAAKKNLFHIMDEGQRLDANAVISYRRLCFYSPMKNIFDAESNPSYSFFGCYDKKRGTCPSGERVCTLLLSSIQKGEIQFEPSVQKGETEHISTSLAIPNTFPNLRVLDIESLKLKSVPDELYDLKLLRYLAMTVDIDLLPKQFKKLRDLETLVFRTTKDKLEIQGGIWNMERLRHVHTNTSIQLPSPKKSKSSSEGTNIRTLCTLSPTSCRKEIISMTPKLQKLNISGNLDELFEEKQGISLLKNLQMLDCLENLKLYGRSNKELKAQQAKFPLKLRKLTLSNTLFGWKDMSVLGSLDMLEVLKLEENSFKGEEWDLNNDVIFKQLRYLRIERANLVTWKAAKNSFPTLERLVLRNCTALETIPDAFADVYSLEVMELFRVGNRAVDSARKVHEQGKNNVRTKGFELFITSLPSETAAAKVEKSNIVGFSDEVKTIKYRLSGGSKDLEIISIVGLFGLGKTTLANMLLSDSGIQYEFTTRLWIPIPETSVTKDVFLDILRKVTDKAYKYKDMSEEQLAHRLEEFLKGEKYLIVIDDVQTLQDWESLKPAFPMNSRGSRVLITTTHYGVGLYVDSTSNPHQLKFLTNEESLQLLEKKVLPGTPGDGDERCSRLLKVHGRDISTKCKGIPLVVELIAKVLTSNETSDAKWERLARDPVEIIDSLDKKNNPLVQLIFDDMDLQLKDCFLYLAAFPEDEITAWKLIWSWIAEGFFPRKGDRYTLDCEHTAEKYLNNLVDKNFVEVLKRRADGQIKSCRIHPKLYQLCKIEAANKNHIHEMDGSDEGKVNEIDCRHLCIKSSGLNFLKSEKKQAIKHVDSFLCFCSQGVPYDEQLATIPKSFPALRVLDIESLKLKSLPKEVYRLYHLRYLAVSTDDMQRLPQDFNNFENMQTLVFNTSQDSLEVEADIWSLPKLRHVRTNTCMQLPLPSSNTGIGSTCIQTLSFISPSSCTAEILSKTPNLQKLGIRGNMVELMESKEGIPLFQNLQKLSRLDNLKLLNNGRRPGDLLSVPQPDKFPRSLRKLTLSNMPLEWKDMCILGALDELEVLKLKECAFTGKSWKLKDDTVFKKLRFLSIGSTDLECWDTSKSCFPVLEKLVLKDCTHLREIPLDFAYVPTLMQMELYGTNEGAANSAHKIQMQQHKLGNNQFKLLIDPPNN